VVNLQNPMLISCVLAGFLWVIAFIELTIAAIFGIILILFLGGLFVFSKVLDKNKSKTKLSNEPFNRQKLLALERFVLLLERSKASAFVQRIAYEGLSVGQYQQLCVEELRQEFNHNLTQQLYVSETLWGKIEEAVQKNIARINTAAMQLDSSEPAIQLAKVLVNQSVEQGENDLNSVLQYLRQEAQLG
jgi:hypothetical protein